MSYLPHQVSASDRVTAVLKKYGLCLLAGETRTGKTRTAIRVAELSSRQRILVLTKKQAISGWESELEAVSPTKDYTVTNYEQAPKHEPVYDFVILDESHNVANRGKPTKRFKDIRRLAYDCPVLCLSGTPAAESTLGFYYQFGITKYTPFKHKTFYDFFRDLGIPSPMRLHGRMVETYKKAKPEVMQMVKPYIVPLTQEAAGIVHKAQDVVHKITLDPSTIAMIEQVKEDQVLPIAGQLVPMDSEAKERVTLHQIESGAIKTDNGLVMLQNTEFVDYIRQHWGDSPDVAVMCHFHATREKIARHLPNVHVYSSDGHAEGVNLSHYKHFVIVNTGYSGAKHVQRRDRIVNLKRTTEALVHILVAADQLSEHVYKAVSRKHDFNLAMYRGLR